MAEHPRFAGIPYGQEGRQGTVYKLVCSEDNQSYALKVFRPSFRYPTIVKKAEILKQYAGLSGMRACSRTVIHPQNSKELLGQYPELLYAAVMPWIEAETWNEVLASKRELLPEQCRLLAEAFIHIMMGLEENGLAHTDLTSSNVMIGLSPGQQWVELVDLEDLYMSEFEEPDDLPEGTDGYKAPFLQQEPIWGPYTDRFSGGILIAEMLAWADSEIREQCWGESYFFPGEMQQPSTRRELMYLTLERLYGATLAGLFERLWNAEQLEQCPSFAEWSVILASAEKRLVPKEDEPSAEQTAGAECNPDEQSLTVEEQPGSDAWEAIDLLPDEEAENRLAKARNFEQQGRLPAALWEYGRLVEGFPENSAIHREIEIVMAKIQEIIDQSGDSLESEGVVQQFQQKASDFNKESLYSKLWIILLGASFIILIIAVLAYLL
ncbi:protein kinase family protein [Paenibacillus azoreducens]|uniref:Protein kinase domain-containing protein n=1 Tax=Paenibacillus azoreducens TaxID=116718 RepID=A0A920CWH9_9BACL|nr:protein kinase family protein [Paenibacillus azoreducens]GIO51582.1 hypothetical protein J34TS1_63470 [Paenibacillus azoreducens]